MSRGRGPRGAWLLAVALSVPLVGACSGGAGPQTSCGGDTTACLTGTLSATGFTATASQLEVSLFREFPSTGAVPLSSVASVGQGGSWAFSNLPAWGHYYVEAVAGFGQAQNVATIVGPLTVPSSDAVPLQVKPVQISVFEESGPGAPLQLQSAQAFLFNPASGAPLQGAKVSISVGGTAVPMPWTSIDGTTYAYVAAFPSTPTPTPAQATYTVTTTSPGGTPISWQLVSAPPTFTPSISAPADGTTVPANQPLAVTWPAQPAADEEIVTLYAQVNGSWSEVYKIPAPDDEDVTTETIPGSFVTPVGQPLLLNVSFVKASCAASSDGCVVGELIVPSQVTPQ